MKNEDMSVVIDTNRGMEVSRLCGGRVELLRMRERVELSKDFSIPSKESWRHSIGWSGGREF